MSSSPRYNVHEGVCNRCGVVLAPGEGEVFRSPLRLACAPCALREAVTDDNQIHERLAKMPIVFRGRSYKLMPFQVHDVKRIATTRALLIGSAMGTGKTAQACVGALRADMPNLVFTPSSVRDNWVEEINRWRPDLDPVVIESNAEFALQMSDILGRSGRVTIASFGSLPGSPCSGCTSLRSKLKLLRKWKEPACAQCDYLTVVGATCQSCYANLVQRTRNSDGKVFTFCPNCAPSMSPKGQEVCLECNRPFELMPAPRTTQTLGPCSHHDEDHPESFDLKTRGRVIRVPYHAKGSLDDWISSGIDVTPRGRGKPLGTPPPRPSCRCGSLEEDHPVKGCRRYKPSWCLGCRQVNPVPNINRKVVLLADECHAFKTPDISRTRNWRELRKRVWNAGGYVFGLSGTPCEGKPAEFWEVLTSLGLERAAFGDFVKNYKRIFKHWYENEKGERLPPEGPLRDELHARLRRIQLNRRRKDVLKELPPRVEHVIPVRITADTLNDVNEAVHRMIAVKRAWEDVERGLVHSGVRLQNPFLPHIDHQERARRRALYESLVDKYFVERPWQEDQEIKEAVQQALLSHGKMPSIDELSRIRALLSQAKLAAVKEWIEDREQEDEPVVLFSYHTSILKKIAERPGWECFHGGLTAGERHKMVKRFQAGDPACVRGLCVSIGAGGEGITLTRASVCGFIDLAWNPAKNRQAEARLIRIGAEQHDVRAAERAIAELGCSACRIEGGKAIPCEEHKTSIVVVRFVADHVVDQLVIATLEEKEGLLEALEWEDEGELD